jgi:hypothetical protein
MVRPWAGVKKNNACCGVDSNNTAGLRGNLGVHAAPATETRWVGGERRITTTTHTHHPGQAWCVHSHANRAPHPTAATPSPAKSVLASAPCPCKPTCHTYLRLGDVLEDEYKRQGEYGCVSWGGGGGEAGQRPGQRDEAPPSKDPHPPTHPSPPLWKKHVIIGRQRTTPPKRASRGGRRTSEGDEGAVSEGVVHGGEEQRDECVGKPIVGRAEGCKHTHTHTHIQHNNFPPIWSPNANTPVLMVQGCAHVGNCTIPLADTPPPSRHMHNKHCPAR